MSELPFRWPVLGFGPDVGPWGDFLVYFAKPSDFEICGSWTLEHGARLGMHLVDSSGNCWEIQNIRSLGPAGSPLAQIIGAIFRQRRHRLDVEFAPKEPMTLDQVKTRAIDVIDAQPHQWRDDEAIAGEAGAPREESQMLEATKDRVRRATSLQELIESVDVPLAE